MISANMPGQTEALVREFILSGPGLGTVDAELTGDHPLLEGVLDSLGIYSLIGFLEQRFGISVADQELVPGNFHSLDAITSFVDAKRAST